MMESYNASYRAREECGKVAKERDAYKRELADVRRELEYEKGESIFIILNIFESNL